MAEEFFFRCPVCKGSLLYDKNCLKCESGHSFDLARQGYVNLLMSQKSSKAHHGDDRLMIQARKAFLEKGYYKNLCDYLAKSVFSYAFDRARILDAGCGDGYYLSSISALLFSK